MHAITFREDAQRTRTGSQPNAHAGIRNLVIAAALRYYGRDDQRILTLCGYAWRALLMGVYC
jgi:hypothetical protein